VNYDQQKREAIANAKHLVELLEEISDEHPGTTQENRRTLSLVTNMISEARLFTVVILDREANRQ